jgi:hypothetical protein
MIKLLWLVAVIPWFIAGRHARCSATFWLTIHRRVTMATRGGKGTDTPHAIVWTCEDCDKEIGETRNP